MYCLRVCGPFDITTGVEPVTDLSHVRLICMGFGILPDTKSLAGESGVATINPVFQTDLEVQIEPLGG